MNLLLKSAGGLVVLAIIAVALLSFPAVQDRLMHRQISKFVNTVPNDLFTDGIMHATVCGSGAPMPIRNRAAACIMVIAGGKFYIVDTGNRSSNNIGLWRIPADRLGGVMLTHFHSDHVGDLGELNMITWAQGRPKPMMVYGPPGVKQVVKGFTDAYALDSHYRTAHHTADYLNPFKGQMIAKELNFDEGADSVVVLEDGPLKVTMFKVNHAPIHPAVGYRFDYRGRSVVISGDTTKQETTIRYSQDADILFHEALAPHVIKKIEVEFAKAGNNQMEKVMSDVWDYHTSPVETAEIANAANVKELVLYHMVPTPPNKIAELVFLRGVSDIRDSGITLGYDGLTYTLPANSDEIFLQDLNERF